MPKRYELDYYKWLHVPDDAEWALIKAKLQPYQDLAGSASQPFFDSLEVLFTNAECRQQYDKHLRHQRARRDALPLAVLMVSAYKISQLPQASATGVVVCGLCWVPVRHWPI